MAVHLHFHKRISVKVKRVYGCGGLRDITQKDKNSELPLGWQMRGLLTLTGGLIHTRGFSCPLGPKDFLICVSILTSLRVSEYSHHQASEACPHSVSACLPFPVTPPPTAPSVLFTEAAVTKGHHLPPYC